MIQSQETRLVIFCEMGHTQQRIDSALLARGFGRIEIFMYYIYLQMISPLVPFKMITY